MTLWWWACMSDLDRFAASGDHEVWVEVGASCYEHGGGSTGAAVQWASSHSVPHHLCVRRLHEIDPFNQRARVLSSGPPRVIRKRSSHDQLMA